MDQLEEHPVTPASGVTRKEFINFMRRTVAACGQLLALDDSRAKWEETLGPVPVGEERLKYELHPPPAGDYVPYWRPIRGCGQAQRAAAYMQHHRDRTGHSMAAQAAKAELKGVPC
ncbi:hypothetical protein N2152v2_010882 [Parachlorella kessleri]